MRTGQILAAAWRTFTAALVLHIRFTVNQVVDRIEERPVGRRLVALGQWLVVVIAGGVAGNWAYELIKRAIER